MKVNTENCHNKRKYSVAFGDTWYSRLIANKPSAQSVTDLSRKILCIHSEQSV